MIEKYDLCSESWESIFKSANTKLILELSKQDIFNDDIDRNSVFQVIGTDFTSIHWAAIDGQYVIEKNQRIKVQKLVHTG